MPAHLACARTSPPHRSNCPRWRASEHSSAGAGCSRAFPSRCVLRSVMHCGPTLSRTPTRAKRTPSQVPTPSRFFAAWGPRRRRVPTQLLRRPDKRESVRDARRAAPGPRAGLGRDVRHVGAGARGALARAGHVGRRRPLTACCCATYSCRCCESERTIAWNNLLGFQCVFQLRAAAVGRFAWWLVAEHMWRSVVMQLQSCSDRFRSLISYSIRSIDSSCIVSMTMSMGCLTDTELHGATARAHAN